MIRPDLKFDKLHISTMGYLQKDGKTLMLHRTGEDIKIAKDKWVGPGGHLISGESPEECIIREFKEETGLIIKHPKLKGIVTVDQKGIKGDWYMFIFVISEFEGNLINSKDGELVWVDNHKLSELDLQPADKEFVKWINKDGIFSSKFVITDEERSHEVFWY